MYEVEYKVEISKFERDLLKEFFLRQSFIEQESFVINDYYIQARESKFGGYDVKRYRDQGNKIIYTEKSWEENDGDKARKEVEREVDRGVMNADLKLFPETIKIQKERQSYSGVYKNHEVHIDMDSVKFDHSVSQRYFIEAEILSNNKMEVKKLRELLIEFLKKSLNKSEIVESPSMFVMAFKKL